MDSDTNGIMLFAYGSLRRSSGHALAAALADWAVFVGPAQFQGRLFRVSDYPGAIASQEPGDRVFGDVYRLPDPEPILQRLDAYEGHIASAETGEYVRRWVTIRFDDGGTAAAWIYLYNRSTAALSRIQSGDFLR